MTTTSTTPSARTGPLDPVGADLTRTLKALKLGQMSQTLPRAARAREAAEDEPRRVPRAHPGRRDHPPRVPLGDAARPHRRTRPLDAPRHLGRTRRPQLRPGPAVGPDQPAVHRSRQRGPRPGTGRGRQNTPGHRARPHRDPAPPVGTRRRADKLFTRLRAARLDKTLEAEVRKLARVDVLILDDFALRALGATETNDFYEIVVERHRRASTIVTSNREPSEWLTMMSDTLLAQSAVDRLTSGAHTLVIEGPSYRQRHAHQRVTLDHKDQDQ